MKRECNFVKVLGELYFLCYSFYAAFALFWRPFSFVNLGLKALFGLKRQINFELCEK
jgi:hypothetical protein